MSDSESNSPAKGFKGLQSLGSKASGPPALPVREAGAPSPPTLRRKIASQPAQPPPSQSQTASPPWRGWVIGIGVVSAIACFLIWVGSQPSSSNYSSATPSTDYQPSPIVETVPATVSAAPTVGMPPVGSDLVLSSDQIRYCLYEDRRIKGAEKVVDNYNTWSVNTFNAMVEDYNSRCGHFRYREGAFSSIGDEANQLQAQLEQEGRERMTSVQSGNKAAVNAAQASADAAAAAAAAAATVASTPVTVPDPSFNQSENYDNDTESNDANDELDNKAPTEPESSTADDSN